MTEAPDTEHTPREFGDVDGENDYTAAKRTEREAEQKARMDAAHEKAKAEKEGEHE